jgi:hypothetical protein
MVLKTHCVYCKQKSDFNVMVRDENEKVIGAMYCCENCRHLLTRTSTIDVWVGNDRKKHHITDIPPVIHSLN